MWLVLVAFAFSSIHHVELLAEDMLIGFMREAWAKEVMPEQGKLEQTGGWITHRKSGYSFVIVEFACD